MFYFDTSFLAPLVIEEDTSELIEIFMTKVPIEQCVTSQFTLVEFANIAARRVRNCPELNPIERLWDYLKRNFFSLQ